MGSIIKAVIEELAVLVALALFLAMVGIWTGLISSRVNSDRTAPGPQGYHQARP